MANKMSDPNSAMMQMVMQMIQNQKPSGNIIKAPQNTIQQPKLNTFKEQSFEQPTMTFQKANIVKSSYKEVEIEPEKNKNEKKIPTYEQMQKAKALTRQFLSTKNEAYSPEQVFEIEEKILQRIMQSMV